ncbi:hypothetical protein HDA33_000467 [Micrococcus endophyticus]|uniref:Uncharacterized protein n=1 Tax=Micrococcus endophyticus TaxID=455343 RepID=A0A7W9MZP8_9MICC|nr:hypothetical protein [Micrococcus endophyticus]
MQQSLTQQVAVPRRVGTVQTAREHRDRLPAGCEHGAMRGSFDPVGAAGDNDAFLVCHPRRQVAGDVLPV